MSATATNEPLPLSLLRDLQGIIHLYSEERGGTFTSV